MTRAAIVLTLLLPACNQWVRPQPAEDRPRTLHEQRQAAMKVVAECDPFEDGGTRHVGTGVMVSDWQILTALHVVDCPAALPTIRVTNVNGQTWRFAPEKEFVLTSLKKRDGVARLQLTSADTLVPRMNPPKISFDTTIMYEPFFVQVGAPRHAQLLGDAYADGERYENELVTYQAPTQSGNSGAGVYDLDNELVGIHLGDAGDGRRYGARVTSEMIPHR